jgi:hypothetical protein
VNGEPRDDLSPAARTALPAVAAAVGLCFAALGVLRPAFVWESAKVAAGRAWLGDLAVGALFVVLGGALVGLAAYAWKKLRR